MLDSQLDPIMVPLREAARLLGINRTRVYELIRSGFLDARKGGRQTLITVTSIREYAAGLPKAKIGSGTQHKRDAA